MGTLMTPIRRKLDSFYYPELSYKLAGLFFKVHNELGRFRTERQYCDRFEAKLKENNYIYSREKDLRKVFEKIEEGGNIPDFIIDNKIIIDFKNKKFITKDDYFQMVRYLDVASLPLGLIVNFRATYLKPKRIVNSKFN
jgi:GxxExxY protein